MIENFLTGTATLFGDHGVSPKRLASGVDWVIEPWEGHGEPTWATLNDMKVLGSELAKLHKVPTDWCDSFSAKLKEENPCRQRTPNSEEGM